MFSKGLKAPLGLDQRRYPVRFCDFGTYSSCAAGTWNHSVIQVPRVEAARLWRVFEASVLFNVHVLEASGSASSRGPFGVRGRRYCQHGVFPHYLPEIPPSCFPRDKGNSLCEVFEANGVCRAEAVTGVDHATLDRNSRGQRTCDYRILRYRYARAAAELQAHRSIAAYIFEVFEATGVPAIRCSGRIG